MSREWVVSPESLLSPAERRASCMARCTRVMLPATRPCVDCAWATAEDRASAVCETCDGCQWEDHTLCAGEGCGTFDLDQGCDGGRMFCRACGGSGEAS